MSTPTELANRFSEVLLNGTWIANTNFQNQLADISLAQAVTQIGSVNTIAALTFHINYYVAGVLNVLQGGDLEIRDQFSFDLPALHTEQEWENLKNTLTQNAEQFAQLLEQLPHDQLQQPFVDQKYGSYLRNIDGMIEHAYYHLGQISLIKKMVVEQF